MGKSQGYKFFLATDQKSLNLRSGDRSVLLFPFKGLSIQPFDFPFSGAGRVRDALRLRFRAILGESVDEIELVPLVSKHNSKLSSGAAFMMSHEESEHIESTLPADAMVWPVPLIFAPKVEGSGLIIWHDAENICALWINEWRPMLYRWSERYEGDLEEFKAYFAEYSSNLGLHIAKSCVESDSREFDALGDALLRALPELKNFDLSVQGANLVEQRERMIGFGMTFARFLIASGLVFAALASVLWLGGSTNSDKYGALASSVYTETFSGSAPDPVQGAIRKLASVNNKGKSAGLDKVLYELQRAWDALPNKDATLDSIRFSADKSEITGTAKSMESIQAIRSSIGKVGFSAKTGDVQQVPGGGFRFIMTLTGGAAK